MNQIISVDKPSFVASVLLAFLLSVACISAMSQGQPPGGPGGPGGPDDADVSIC